MSINKRLDAEAVHSVRLRRWLPLSLLLAALMIFVVMLVLQFLQYQRNLDFYVQGPILKELLHLKHDLEAARGPAGAQADVVMAGLQHNPAVRFAAVVDSAGKVLEASADGLAGESFTELLPGYSMNLLDQVFAGGQEHIDLDEDARTVQAMVPLLLHSTEGEAQASEPVVLLIAYDISKSVVQAWDGFLEHALVFGLATMLAALVLASLGRWGILRPVNALRHAMERIGAGEFNAPINFTGRGEFKSLADTLGLMAGKLQESTNALAESKERFKQLSEAAFEAIVIHENGYIVDANRVSENLIGLPPGGLIGKPVLAFVAHHDREEIKQRLLNGMSGSWMVDLQNAKGEIIPCEASSRQKIVNKRVVRITALRDMRKPLDAENRIRHLSQYDPLTGLHNRHYLIKLVDQEQQDVLVNNNQAALAVLNINSFKLINDTYGMVIGDAVLRSLARRMGAGLQRGQFPARISADSFALLITGLGAELAVASTRAAHLVEDLLRILNQPFKVDETLLNLSVRSGLVMITTSMSESSVLLSYAESAMHQAKLLGDNRVHFFDSQLQASVLERVNLRNDLERVLKSGLNQLVLYYQPQVDADGSVIGVEALIRWQHPERGLIPPAAFIAEAEASGLIVPLGYWVLSKAMEDLRRWQNHPDTTAWASTLSVAVNVSPRQFAEPDFVERLEDILQRAGVGAHHLELELTESVVANDIEVTVNKMLRLRKAGVRFALDDFGTGYSSLAYLRNLPIDTLKIDQSFMADLEAADQHQSEKHATVLIEAIIVMAHKLGLQVLAEGIEKESQKRNLLKLNCDSFQGYYFSRPLPELDMIYRCWKNCAFSW